MPNSPKLTVEHVASAYDALMSLDRDRALEYWTEDVRFQMPGNHHEAGWHEGLDAYLTSTAKLIEVCGGVMKSETLDVLIDDAKGITLDVYRISGKRGHAPDGVVSPYEFLAIEGAHLLRWRDGRVFEGRGGLFGDGATRANLWWSPVGDDGRRTWI